jgi:hypothetical protein
MPHIIVLGQKVADIFLRYRKIHRAVFGFHLRSSLAIPGIYREIDHCLYRDALGGLRAELIQIQATLGELPAEEPTTRSTAELRSTLKQYTDALGETIENLHTICDRSCTERQKSITYDTAQCRADKISYDKSLQVQKRLGGKLTELFSRF